MLLRLAALLTILVSAFFLQRAANPIFEQNGKVGRWPAVDVTVIVRFVETPVRGQAGRVAGDALGNVPAVNTEIEHRHEVAGVLYRTRRFNPTADEMGPVGPELIEKRESSYVRRGHYDPERPDRVLVPKALGFRDYLPVFIWAPFLAIGFGGMLLRKPGRSARAPLDRAAKGWHRLRARYSIAYRARGAWGVAVVCNALVGLAVYDYFTGEPRARSAMSDVLVGLAAAPGLVMLGLAVYYSWMAWRVGEPIVSIDAVRVRPGERLAVKVELPLKRELDLEHVVVGLTCVRSSFEQTGHGPGWRERERYAERVERDVGGRGRTGTRVTFEQRFVVPPGGEASTLARAGLFGPWIDWFVEVRFHLDHGPDYRGRFPVTVEAV